MPRNSASDNWNTVEDESQVKFDSDGDVFTGILLSRDTKGKIRQSHFTGTGEFKDSDYFTNEGVDLSRKLDKVPVGSEVRITRTGTQDTGMDTPMMLFKVDWRTV